MKVGLIAFCLNHDNGSMRRYTLNLIKSLNKIHNVNIELIIDKKVDYLPNKQIVIPYFPKLKRLLNIQIPVLLRKYAFDIIHYPDAIPINFKQNQHVVFTLHGITPLILPKKISGVSALKRVVLHKLLKFICNNVDACISVSNAERKEIISSLNITPSRVTTVHNGVSTNIFRQIDKKETRLFLKERFGIDKKFLFHASTYRPTKNLTNILKALSLIKNKPLLVIGGNLGEYKNSILNTIKKLKLSNDVLIIGNLKEKEMVYLYNGAIATLLPSFHESFGLPILESMACGTPVITSNIYAPPEIAGDAGVYVNPYDIESIKDAIEKLIVDTNYRNKKIKKGLKRASMFTWEKCAKDTFKVYTTIKKV